LTPQVSVAFICNDITKGKISSYIKTFLKVNFNISQNTVWYKVVGA